MAMVEPVTVTGPGVTDPGLTGQGMLDQGQGMLDQGQGMKADRDQGQDLVLRGRSQKAVMVRRLALAPEMWVSVLA
jgi:hypothetical protein